MKRKNSSQRSKIKLRIRNKIKGSANRPRLSVFRSNKEIYAQLIDDRLLPNQVTNVRRQKQLVNY